MKYFLARSFQNGDLPFWCSGYFCGAPFLSDIQSGVFYPPSLLFGVFPFPLSFNLYVCIHFFLGFFFCFLFLRRTGRSIGATLFGATAFGYGGFTIATVNTLNNLTTAIWLPAVLWAFMLAQTKGKPFRSKPEGAQGDRIDTRRPGYGLALLFLVMAILGGEPQLVIMIVGLLFFYAIISAHDGSWRHASRQGINVAALTAAAILIAMVQLGPTFLDFRLSARTSGFDYEMATAHSLPVEALKHLIVPLRFPPDFAFSPETLARFFPEKGKIPWLLTIYPGFLILPLAIFAITADFGRKNLFWIAVFAFSIFLALGHHTPVYFCFYKLLPFFRFPEKFMFIAGFCLVVLAATGLDRLLVVLHPRRIRPGFLLCLLLVTLVADLYAAHKHLNPTCKARFYHLQHPDLGPIVNDPERFRVFMDPDIDASTAVHLSLADRHTQWQLLQLPHLGIITGIDHVDGNTGMELDYQWLIYEILHLPWPQRVGLLRAANVRYIISEKPLDSMVELKDRIERVSPIVYRIKNDLPRAWLVGQTAPHGGNPIAELTASTFEPSATAIVKGETTGKYGKPAFTPVDSVEYPAPGRIRVKLSAPGPALLILAESFYPGWKVSIDGKQPQAPLSVNAVFQGVEVSPGHHKVEFVYRTPYFGLYAGISMAAIAGILLLGLWSGKARGLGTLRRSGLSV